MPRPAALCMRTQTPAASRIAIPSQNSPTPSRWWSGCRSWALRPTRRTVNPSTPATSIHPAQTVRKLHPAKMTSGSLDCCALDWAALADADRPRADFEEDALEEPLPDDAAD